ncbi:MAG: PIG-L family deacetylase [Gemmatimonadota bacterium]|nr:PIG-L family deacetylase [Gemmatimonadota bacterium]
MRLLETFLRQGAALIAVGGLSAASPWIKQVSNYISSFDVIVVAHQDDWQVFMGDVISQRLHSAKHVTFVYLTAGDDGRDSVYWETRERAALQSVRVADGIPAPDSVNCSTVQVRAHPIKRCRVGNTDSYFFRLPDGNRNGKGFARYGYQSLRKLQARPNSEISSIDGSTTYHGWIDLEETVRALVERDSSAATVHTTDPNIARNPHDHFDHRMAGLLIADLRKQKDFGALYYVGYALATRAANRSSDQTRAKTTLFLAYDREMMAANKKWSAYQEHRAFYAECMQRTYYTRR